MSHYTQRLTLIITGISLSCGLFLALRSQSQPIRTLNNQEEATNTVTQIYPVREDFLAVEISTGSIIHAQQQIYKPQLGDRIEPQANNSDLVKTLTEKKGSLVGKDKKILYPFDRRSGLTLEAKWLSNSQTYSIQSSEDPQYKKARSPELIHHKTKPTDMGETNSDYYAWQQKHTAYLKLPAPLVPGKTYTLRFQGDRLTPQTFIHQPDSARSEAVHVSQLGFRPDDPSKIAFLSTWIGTGGGLSYGDPNQEPRTFWLREEQSGRTVFQGKTSLRRNQTEAEDPKEKNYNATPVYGLDFTPFNKPGRYQVCVAAIGCSFPFSIAQEQWQKAFYISARGFYHQRSGIEMKRPYTSFKRPLNFHPKAGPTVYASTTRLMDTDQGLWNKPGFSEQLAKTKTKTVVPNAWGGYFDAGDWDRRIQHVEASQNLLELAELFPTFIAKTALNLPESENKTPDLIDEALWNLDFYRRLQTQDGGIRGGIQSINDPKRGEMSWQESGEVYAYAPDPWASYIYAAGAAQLAQWLKPQNPEQSKIYQTSALRAMAYAERELPTLTEKDSPKEIRDRRNHAALELYRLTSDPKWHQLFITTSNFREPNNPTDRRGQLTAAFLYSRMPKAQTEAKLQAETRQAILTEADIALAQTQKAGFGWAKTEPDAPIGWGHGLGTPHAIALLRGHFLSQETKYLSAALLSSQFSAGANPDNMVFTTGLGLRSPKHPLVFDQRLSNQDPPPGITVYGPFDKEFYGDFWTIKEFKESLHPNIESWPSVETHFDVFLMPITTEFTIMETIGPTTYTWGYLAARQQIKQPETIP
jgi:endoglucanase